MSATEHKKVLNAALAANAAFCFAQLICAFVVASSANNGFNAVLTALLAAAFAGGAYRVLNRSQSTLALGFVIGVGTLMCFVQLMSAIYWGQLSGCEKPPDGEKIDQYSCDNPKAYGATCAFGVLLFLIDVSFTVLLVLWRDDFTADGGGQYEDIGSHGSFTKDTGAPPGDAGTYAAYDSGSYKVPPSSADL